MPDPTPLSPEAKKAKESTMQSMRDEIRKGIVDGMIEMGIPPTAELVEQQYKNLTSTIDPATKAKRKYSKINGKDGKVTLVPTDETMEEFGNAAARSVDEGMNISWLPEGMGGFGKLLNKLWTAIRALFEWATGDSKSFTEAYAKVTAGDISDAMNKNLAGMAKDPEHQQFIKNNDVVNKGKDAIGHAVRVEAGLEEKPKQFKVGDYIASKKPAAGAAGGTGIPTVTNNPTTPLEPTASPEQRITQAFNDITDPLIEKIKDSDQKKKLEKLKPELAKAAVAVLSNKENQKLLNEGKAENYQKLAEAYVKQLGQEKTKELKDSLNRPDVSDPELVGMMSMLFAGNAANLKAAVTETAVATAPTPTTPATPAGPAKSQAVPPALAKVLILDKLKATLLPDASGKLTEEGKQLELAIGRKITDKELNGIAEVAAARSQELLDSSTDVGKHFAKLSPIDQKKFMYNWLMFSGTDYKPTDIGGTKLPPYDKAKPGLMTTTQQIAPTEGNKALPSQVLAVIALGLSDGVMENQVLAGDKDKLAQYKKAAAPLNEAWIVDQKSALIKNQVRAQVDSTLMPLIEGYNTQENREVANILAIMASREGVEKIDAKKMREVVTDVIAEQVKKSQSENKPLDPAELKVAMEKALRANNNIIGLPEKEIKGINPIAMISDKIAANAAHSINNPGKSDTNKEPLITKKEVGDLRNVCLEVVREKARNDIEEHNKSHNATALGKASQKRAEEGAVEAVRKLITGEANEGGLVFADLNTEQRRKLVNRAVWSETREKFSKDTIFQTNAGIKSEAPKMIAEKAVQMLVPDSKPNFASLMQNHQPDFQNPGVTLAGDFSTNSHIPQVQTGREIS